MRIYEQKWDYFTRIIIAHEGGSVQVDLYDKEQEWGGTAFLYGLWVDRDWRRQDIAKSLMYEAELQVKMRGHKSITLEWKLLDTSVDILKWYERIGYCQKSFDGRGSWALMRKEL